MTAPQTSRLPDAAWNPRTAGSAGTTAAGSAWGSTEPAATPGCTADRHGTLYAYQRGCRCPATMRLRARRRKLASVASERGVPLSVPAVGTKRRLRALMALGWRHSDLAARLGATRQNITYHASDDSPTVYRTTAEAVARLYDELADHKGPSEKSARIAARKGWLQPLWFDDDTIDDPTYVPKTTETLADRRREDRAERLGEVARLTDKGLSAAQIALRLGVTQRQVVRDRLDLRGREAS